MQLLSFALLILAVELCFVVAALVVRRMRGRHRATTPIARTQSTAPPPWPSNTPYVRRDDSADTAAIMAASAAASAASAAASAAAASAAACVVSC